VLKIHVWIEYLIDFVRDRLSCTTISHFFDARGVPRTSTQKSFTPLKMYSSLKLFHTSALQIQALKFPSVCTMYYFRKSFDGNLTLIHGSVHRDYWSCVLRVRTNTSSFPFHSTAFYNTWSQWLPFRLCLDLPSLFFRLDFQTNILCFLFDFLFVLHVLPI
jgi:hypothetical protein